ncbi:NAD(P)-binding protein [Pyxidicoccus parkwayensis]|uniref:NAD(P)-binding protein n=1 Tax=Pyxidicoccus parkwayensis TaxID=2813578 RepID=A0ABX7NJ03_9BACT|nr:NAD(P)-binding protein [Pyxidicoccus parkwaysis]QSQ18840.1 NAD(P)-binding protein [Pyxidicoccus parkwaysis]
MPAARTRIAILGGGPSALAAAFHLTSTSALRQRYEVTVYQMGWRLGGKGRSGRGPDGRIEEHGLHILFGFYENFFSMIRACYAELDRPASHPMATWRHAFEPHTFGLVEEWFQGRWHHWPVEFPSNDAVPGNGSAFNSGGDYVSFVLHSLLEFLLGWRTERRVGDVLHSHRHDWRTSSDSPETTSGRPDARLFHALRLLRAALKLAGRASASLHSRAPVLLRLMRQVRRLVIQSLHRRSQDSIRSYRVWAYVDFWSTVFIGMMADRLYEPGALNAIDEYDLRDWLRKHGAHEDTLQSAFVRTIYGAAFSYAQGDPERPLAAAGSALRALFRMGFTYKGAAYYKMRSGMGDVVFTPLYQVLQRRGVRFEFFHKVESLHLTPEKDAIASVHFTRQATLRHPESGYDPLVDVGGLECWPSEPRWEQLEDAEQLKGFDLESYYTPWKGVGTVTLKAGEDFDQVLLATPIACIPFLCGELLEHSPRWRNMVRHVKSVQTLSLQVWMDRTLAELGWDMPSPLLSLYVEPMNTWAEMSQTLHSEPWPEAYRPRAVHYFTGPQSGPDLPPPATDHDYPAREKQRAREEALTFLRHHFTPLVPGAADPRVPPRIDWNRLVDPRNGEGEERLEAQYYRSNCDPADRCTVAFPGATKFRMKAGDTGYANLVIAGDWIDNGLYVACMEGAVQGGILAARALSGMRFRIIGEELGWDAPRELPANVTPLGSVPRRDAPPGRPHREVG